jgi:lysozyme
MSTPERINAILAGPRQSEPLLDQIKRHEGFRPRPYRCTSGRWTIGYGLNLDSGISERLASQILEWQIADFRTGLAGMVPFWHKLSPARQDVFINMAFNLGMQGLFGFRRMLEAADKGNVAGVCAEMRDSKWARQVGKRAEELIQQYEKG